MSFKMKRSPEREVPEEQSIRHNVHYRLQKTNWLFDVPLKKKQKFNELTFGRVKFFFYERLYDCLTRHDLDQCHELLKLIPKDNTFDQYILLRFIMILIDSGQPKRINKNVIDYTESLVSQLDMSRQEILLEFIAFFIRHDRVDDARDLFVSRIKELSRPIHRKLPYIDSNLSAYACLFSYIDWENKNQNRDSTSQIDISTQGWLVNAMAAFKSVESNHEYLVFLVIKVLLHYGYIEKAYAFAGEFQRNNPENISAQLLLLSFTDNLLEFTNFSHDSSLTDDYNRQEQYRLESLDSLNNFSISPIGKVIDPSRYPIEEERRQIEYRLTRLDPGNPRVTQLMRDRSRPVELMVAMLNGLENVARMSEMWRWHELNEVLQYISTQDEHLFRDAHLTWQTRYSRFWSNLDILTLVGDLKSPDDKSVLQQVMHVLKSQFGEPINYWS